jgi:hypothetical protein
VDVTTNVTSTTSLTRNRRSKYWFACFRDVNGKQRQGQYLAFICAYTHVLGRPPGEADLHWHFGVSPLSVHQLVLTLERTGSIRRKPGLARSSDVLVAPELLPILR